MTAKSKMIFLFAVVNLATIVSSTAAGVRNVMLFYESFCPACMEEMKTEVTDAIKTFGGDIFISPVPYGNALMNISANGKISIDCQHGQNECIANTWHACTQIFMTPQERIQYTICTMSQGDGRLMKRLKTCTTPTLAAILKNCVDGPMGAGLNKLMADITGLAGIVWDSEKRRLESVPTVFIDGYPVPSNLEDLTLVQKICKIANPKPKQCSKTNVRYEEN